MNRLCYFLALLPAFTLPALAQEGLPPAPPPIPEAPGSLNPANPFSGPEPIQPIQPIQPLQAPQDRQAPAALPEMPPLEGFDEFEFFQPGAQLDAEPEAEPAPEPQTAEPEPEPEAPKPVRRAPKPRFSKRFDYKIQRLPETIYRKQYRPENRHLPRAQYERDYDAATFAAAAANNLNGVRAMLEHGGRSIAMRDAGGRTLVDIAVQNRAHAVLRYLIARGAPRGTAQAAPGDVQSHYALRAGR